MLICAAGPKIGLLITSKQKVNCSFQPEAHETARCRGTIPRVSIALRGKADAPAGLAEHSER